MPSNIQFAKLIEFQWEWMTLNDVEGRKFTATNGNSIFLPATYTYSNPDLNSCYYWTSTLSTTENCTTSEYTTNNACAIFFNARNENAFEGKFKDKADFTNYLGSFYRYNAHGLRPAIHDPSLHPEPKPEPEMALKNGYCPGNNHPHAIDMGIGVK